MLPRKIVQPVHGVSVRWGRSIGLMAAVLVSLVFVSRHKWGERLSTIPSASNYPQGGVERATIGRAAQNATQSLPRPIAPQTPPGHARISPTAQETPRRANDMHWVTASLDQYASLAQEEVEPVWRELDSAHQTARSSRGLPPLVDMYERRQSEFNMAITMLQMNVSTVCEIGMGSGEYL